MDPTGREGVAAVELDDERPTRSGRRLLAVNLAILAVLLLIGYLVLRDRTDDERVTEPSVPASSSTTTPTVDELLAIVPASPIDGKESWRLPVVATPRVAVSDGQVVTVLGKGFLPGESIGAVMCASESGIEGVAACDLGTNGTFDHVTYTDASPEGFVAVDVALRQMIVTPSTGPIDCASAPERCLVALGAVSDYDRSGGTFVDFAGAPPFATPTISLDPTGPYVPGQVVTVHGATLLAPREVQVEQCRDARCAVLARGRVAPDGTFDAEVAVAPTFVAVDGSEVTCDDGCVVRVSGIGLPEATSAPAPEPLPITFVAIAEPVPPPVTPTPDTVVTIVASSWPSPTPP